MEGSQNTTSWSNISESVFFQKSIGIRTVVGATCALSIIGSVLIILSYVRFKELRTYTRLILLHISLMDLGVALANLIGVAVYFDGYYLRSLAEGSNVSLAVNYSCYAQAWVALFCTTGSVLWTVTLAVYLYFLVLQPSNVVPKKMFFYLCILNYSLPMLVSLWGGCTKRLGYDPTDSSGWCTLKVIEPSHYDKDIFSAVFGNDLWVYLATVLIIVLYLGAKLHVKEQIRFVDANSMDKYTIMLHSIDYKFTVIPAVFVGLRIWSCILGILYDYAQLTDLQIPHWTSLLLIYLAGIGDSGQGAVNGLLFVLLTKRTRELVCSCYKDDYYHTAEVQTDADYDDRSFTSTQPISSSMKPYSKL